MSQEPYDTVAEFERENERLRKERDEQRLSDAKTYTAMIAARERDLADAQEVALHGASYWAETSGVWTGTISERLALVLSLEHEAREKAEAALAELERERACHDCREYREWHAARVSELERENGRLREREVDIGRALDALGENRSDLPAIARALKAALAERDKALEEIERRILAQLDWHAQRSHVAAADELYLCVQIVREIRARIEPTIARSRSHEMSLV